MKKTIFALMSVLLLVGAGCASAPTPQTANESPAPAPSEQQPPQGTLSPSPATPPQGQPSPKPSEEAPGTSANVYTMNEIAVHKDGTSCWSAINDNVYDLTNWISQHPGGPQAIQGLCGKDGTSAFNGQHGGSALQENKLATFKIGTIKK